MERINQRTNHLVGTNIRKMRIERKLRSVGLLIALTDIFRCDFNAFFEE